MFRITRGTIRQGGELYEVGDEIELDERTAAQLSDRVEAVEELPFDPSELTNDGVEEAVQDVDDIDVLQQLVDTEQSGSDRTGAIEALEDRIDELTE